MSNPETKSTLDKKPPFFKSWKQIYLMVLGTLGVLIILFYWFTISFS